MSRLLSERLVRTFLGALFALAIGLPAVQAGGMALKMASSLNGGEPVLGSCTACGNMDKPMGSGACSQLCPVPALGVVLTGTAPIAEHTSTVPLAGNWALGGRTFAPDPHPPRHNEIVDALTIA